MPPRRARLIWRVMRSKQTPEISIRLRIKLMCSGLLYWEERRTFRGRNPG